MNDAPRAFQVVDLAYGDCGKGTIVDFLTRRFDVRAIVRFNGGPQAGHNVVTPAGQHHTFAQLGSGSFVPGVRTLLSRFMLIEPYALFREAQHLERIGIHGAIRRLEIDARCLVITPPQIAANHLRELARGASAHGTCGIGVGETMKDSIDAPALVLRAGELADRQHLRSRLCGIVDYKLAEMREIIEACHAKERARPAIETLRNLRWIDAAVETYTALSREAAIVESLKIPTEQNVIFEGAQGVLLDETAGFQPHTTWSTTTFVNADRLLDESHCQTKRIRIGVLRSYFTRHGPGPFVTEDASLRPFLPEPHNDNSGWQGEFRVGLFDAVAARYAIETCGGVDCLALTHLDRVPSLPAKVCDAYLLDGRSETRLRADTPLALCRPSYTSVDKATEGFTRHLVERLGVPIGIQSFGPTHADKSITTVSRL
jgi:adenylosuccinate synthase